MAKRGYKLQEFMAHSGNVNCLSLAKKRRGLFITGADDHIVNLWSIGKPTALTSLCGHSSPVESVAFDSKEAFVVAGASAGAIKLWDLDETKMVRTLNGHRSYCTAVEFHPFGEFLASGSKDTNLKIWDIRKKECIHTYKGHTRGISTVRFTPDGRWVVSGGFDNVVKIWDLTAGKLLHDFKLHEGHIRSIDFHPIEFLLATGSADRTVKFWDLETFELIGSSRPESKGVRSITFHPEGRTLFSGLDDSLKVYSWEPIVCHDAVDMGWSTLGDLCIQDGKLLGGSYYQNFVGVWVTDISLMEPYRESSQPEPISNCEQRQNFQETSLQKVGSFRRSTSTSSLRCISPDNDAKEIKNIYVDTEGVNPVTSRKVGSIKYPKIVSSSNAKEINKSPTQRQVPAVGLPVKPIGQAITKSFVVPTVVPRDSSDGKQTSKSWRESITSAKAGIVMSVKPSHIRRPSNTTLDVERLPTTVVPRDSSDGKQTSKSRRESITSAKAGIVMSVKPSHIRRPSNTTLDVERLPTTVEIKAGLDITRDSNIYSRLVADDDARESSEEKPTNIESVEERCEKFSLSRIPSNQENCNESLDENKGVKTVKYVNGVAVVRGRTRSLVERFERRENFQSDELQTPDSTPQIFPVTVKAPSILAPDLPPRVIPDTIKSPTIAAPDLPPRIMPDTVKAPTIVAPDLPPQVMPDTVKAPTKVAPDLSPRIMPDTVKTPAIVAPDLPPRIILDTAKASTMVEGLSIHHSAPHKISGTLKKSPRNSHPEMIRRETMIHSGDTVTEDLMKNHDVFLSTLRSRLTKLQVVRHFLEQNDIKGAINAMQKLPDHSVQADLISFLMGKMEILTLDLFLCLLPMLLGLLDSNAERHVNVSLELLLKLVAVFGPVIRSTISAPPVVGVNLQAEQRLECCNQCFILLQKIQKILPALIRRGGLLAKCALELTLVLQDS